MTSELSGNDPHRAAALLLVLLAQRDVGRPHERAHAQRQRLPEDDDAADEREAADGAGVDAAQLSALDDDRRRPGLRQAMAMLRGPRIITPSITAWPP